MKKFSTLTVWRHGNNERARHPKAGEFVNWRGWIDIRSSESDKARSLASGQIQIVLARKGFNLFSARLHVGTLASETPFDGNLQIGGAAVYWGIGNGRKLAQWLTHFTGDEHEYDGRDIGVAITDGGALSWDLWVHRDRTEPDEFARWRDQYININLLDRIWGPKRYDYANLATAAFMIDMPEGSYPVVATVQRQTYSRTKSRRIIEQKLVLDVHAQKGVPYRYDSSGGWKGDRVYGFSLPFKMPREQDWQIDAKAAITGWVYQRRADTGFRTAQEQSS
ncbi:hypothetical protein CH273_25600 [Rhodococcus sp. 05-339-2]|uniref:hypothetical protein n=1 Tax=Rhodococcoides fascians TaxID=1828 RepID=UPI00050C8340|nr:MULTISPECIES: hypothetical protein [Rhodococcus]OZD74868.1 hypothetical protein CH273_25600 [Rhodococcus sp. 05-339-2]